MNNQVNCNSRGIAAKLSCMLFGGVSVLALGVAMPAAAQDSQTMETVTVTGQRAAIQSAMKIKENADQIVDSIVADDAGKLPDRSITEVLQRVSGVTITHFNNPGSPDDYTVEGSGPAVRGLPGGTSTINGHNAFSANGGRNILWGDVPSELMAAVDVFKTYTPDQIEGGLGGTINLRTRLPFDFDGSKVAGRLGVSYGDLIKQGRPAASLMGSTRFDTKLGEMGVLLSLSYDDSSYRNDAIQVDPYYPHTNVLENYTLDTSGTTPVPKQTGNTVYWLPGGFGYHTSFGFHKRGGASAAFEWRPSDKLLINARVFSSVNQSTEYSYGYSTGGDNRANYTYPLSSNSDINTLGTQQLTSILSSGKALTPADAAYHIYDSNHNLVYANTYFDTGFVTGSGNYVADGVSTISSRCDGASKLCSLAKTETTAQEHYSRTTDINLGADWTPTDNWTVRGGLDFIYSKANFKSLQVEGDAVTSPYGIDLTGNYPRFVFSDPSALKTSSSYFWNDTMDDRTKNYGQESQANIDVDYRLDSGIFKTVKFGVRGDLRTERDNDTGYNWQPLSPLYRSGQFWWSDPAAKNDITLYQFPNFFRGEVNLPGPALFVNLKEVANLDAGYFQNKYNTDHLSVDPANPYSGAYSTVPFDQYNAKHYKTVNVAAYAMVTFAKDSVLGMPMSGNAGARLVYVDNQASGYWTTSGNTLFKWPNDSTKALYATVPSNIPVQGGRVSWTLLPAFNVQFQPTDQMHIRFAGSITAEQPTFAGIYGTSSIATVSSNDNTLTSFNFGGDDPRLKPQIGRNFDMSFEWYGDGADAHISGFYKSIKHKTVSGFELRNVNWAIGQPKLNSSGDGCDTSLALKWACQFNNGYQVLSEPTITKTNKNSDKEAVIRGVEIGFTKYFDWSFVPSSLKGFGFSGNYTYVDSRAPGSFSFDMLGNNLAQHLPMEGLSKHSFNAQLMYDRDPVSFRLAYNWRNKYLMLASGYNTGGTYLASDNGVSCPLNNSATGGGGNLQDGTCTFALPVWSKAFGSLDAGMDYKLDEHFQLTIQSQNLLNTKAKTTMGYGANEYSRGYFVSDRRVSMDLRMNF